jgi:predicted transposase YdaD
MGTLRVDKLVQVYRLDGTEDWLLVHVEVQSQTDNDLPWRMYQYYHRIADRYKKAVVSLAVLADEQASWRPQVYEQAHWGCKLRFEYLICKLLDYNRTSEELGADLNPIAVVVAAHFAAMATRGNPDNRFNLKWQLTRKLYERGYSKQEVLNLYRLIDWVLAMSKEMELAFEEKIVAYEKETSMPYITSAERIGIEKGIEKGIEEGLQKGRQDGQTSLIVRMLKRRWGAMDPELEVRLSRLSLAQLESLGETLMDFRDPSDLQRWLDDNANRVN